MTSRLRWRERRAMGLTFANIRRTLTRMEQAGQIQGKSASILAVDVLNELVEQNPQAYKVPDIDWDALLEFLEKLIELILRLFF